MAEGQWFYCIRHQTVEGAEGCADRHRLGPFETRDAAAHALERVAERNEEADAADRAWDRGEQA